MELLGRRKILLDVMEVTIDNVIDVLNKALSVHLKNRDEIVYLYDYYRGDQPILSKTKDVRPEINNMIVENRAHEIVSFKTSYLMGEPVQYVSRTDDESLSQQISKLNDYCLAEGKASKDKTLVEWGMIAGTGYRMVLPDIDAGEDPDESPFELYTLDPRSTFVAYRNDLGETPLMGVKYITRENGDRVYSVYTDRFYFEVVSSTGLAVVPPAVQGGVVTKAIPHYLGAIPIIEYPANNARLGCFEIVLDLLDAINQVDSDRVDGIDQFIQALLLFHNVDISPEDYATLRSEGAIKFRDIDPSLKAEIEYLTAELNQAQTQTLVDHMYKTVLTIVGMPNRNGGSSTSDTGIATIYRDGFTQAESRAKDSEQMFKESEREFLKQALRISSDLVGLSVRVSTIDIKFTRRNYENITEKANVLNLMLNNNKIAPQLAFIHCGMFADPEAAYAMSDEYYQSVKDEAVQLQEENNSDETEEDDPDPTEDEE